MTVDLTDAPQREAAADLAAGRAELAAIQAELQHGLEQLVDCIDGLKDTELRLRATRIAMRRQIETADFWLDRLRTDVKGGA